MSGPTRRSGRDAATSTETQAWALVRAAAAHGLPGAPSLPTAGLAAETWTRAVRLAEQQRVLGLLVAAVTALSEADGRVATVPEGARVELFASHEAWCAHDLRLERALGQAADALRAVGIAFLVTKGPALAHRAYPEAGQRLFADLDLVVPSGQVHRATHQLAEALDAEVVVGELRPGFDERFGKETLLRIPPTPAVPAGLEVDLHRTPVAGALGLAIQLDDLFRLPDELVLGSRRFPIPDPAASLVLAAYQASVADIPPRLGARRDLVQLCLGRGGTDVAGGPGDGRGGGAAPLEADAVVALAQRWRAGSVLATAVVDAWFELGLPQPTTDQPLARDLLTWARSYRPGLGERLVLDAHRRAGYVYWRQLVGVAVVSGRGARLDYLRALLWPQATYLADRSWSLGRHLRRAIRALDAPLRIRLVASARRLGRRWGWRA